MSPPAPLIVNCGHGGGGPSSFFSRQFGDSLRWRHLDADSWHWLRHCPGVYLPRLRAGLAAALVARRWSAQLVVSHGPSVTFACEWFKRRLGQTAPHLAFSFNFTALPTGRRLRAMRSEFGGVDRFLVYSTMERQLYHQTFGIPLDRISFHHWAVAVPHVTSPDRPLVGGEYVCAIGGNARDYPTLVEAARRLPGVRFVVVARPHNLVGLSLPANVEVRVNLPFGEAMNVLAFSRFMVLPLVGSEVPCGHVTLVGAMHLGRAFVISDSTGVSDYVVDGSNALTCTPLCADSLSRAVLRLWEDRELCDRLGRNGQTFAARHCSESSMVAWFANYLADKGLLGRESAAGVS